MQEEVHSLGSKWRIFWLQASDGIRIRCGMYADTPSPKAYVLFSSGRGEYIEKYAYLPRDLQLDPDTAFLIWDHRGQGASGGIRFHVDSYDRYVDDVQILLQTIVEDRPYTLLGHSMGSLIALYGLLAGKLLPQTVCLSAPLLGFRVSPAIQWGMTHFLTVVNQMGWQTKRLLPYEWKKFQFEGNPFTHSPERFKAFLATPFPSQAMTFSWLAATQVAIEQVFLPEKLASLSIPVHVFLAGEDEVVENAESVRWLSIAQKFAPCKPKATWIPGARHELFFEGPPYYEAVLQEVLLGKAN